MVKGTDILIWYDFIEGCVSKELVSRGSLPILCGLFRVTKGVFAKRFGKINKKFCWHWTNNQQLPNWQYIDSLWNQTTVLQRIGVRLHHYATRLVLLGSTNDFYSFTLQEKRLQKGSIEALQRLRTTNLARKSVSRFEPMPAQISHSSKTTTPLASCKENNVIEYTQIDLTSLDI